MKTWEMIKELTENPKKRFRRKRDGLEVSVDTNNCLSWNSGYPPFNINHVWEEVKEPVSFMEALELIKSGKIDRKTLFTLDGKIGYERERLDNILERLTDDYYADGIANILLEGKFYIED